MDKDGFDFIEPQAAGLEVKLDTSDAVAGPRDLKVHLAEEVFFTNDVGDVGDGAIVCGETTHRDARAGGGDGHARIHHGQATTANGRHGRRTVGFGDVRDHADGVREIFRVGQDGQKRTLSEGTVANFAATRSHDPTGLAYTEGWEVVVQVELLGELWQQAIDDLLIATGTQGARDQRLGFSPLEQC